MAVPIGAISLQDVCNEIYGNFTPSKNLNQCFIDAIGTFDPLYNPNTNGTNNNLMNFQNYNNSLIPLVYDYDGNSYQPVKIGTQIWLSSDLITKHLTNGTAIYSASDITDLYNHSTIPAVLADDYYGYWTPPYSPNPGNLSAWYNGATIDGFSYLIAGYHIPTYAELSTLGAYLGSSAGGHLKGDYSVYYGWQTPNTGADNTTGFNGYPMGRLASNQSYDANKFMYFWLSDFGLKDDGINYNWRWGTLQYNYSTLTYSSWLVSSNNSTTIRLIKN